MLSNLIEHIYLKEKQTTTLRQRIDRSTAGRAYFLNTGLIGYCSAKQGCFACPEDQSPYKNSCSNIIEKKGKLLRKPRQVSLENSDAGCSISRHVHVLKPMSCQKTEPPQEQNHPKQIGQTYHPSLCVQKHRQIYRLWRWCRLTPAAPAL